MTNDELYNLVPIGKENAKPLSYFTELTGIGGRPIRKRFEQLGYLGKIVCNHRHHYFRASDKDDLKIYRKIIHSYICKLLKKEYRIDKAIETFDMERMA